METMKVTETKVKILV